MKPAKKAQVPEENESSLALLWDALFDKDAKEMAERPVRDVMVPTKFFVKPEDPITKAAYMMIHHDIALLPVLENNKFIGAIRMTEVFKNLSEVVL
jgi:predicted transcriptional regulator